MSYKANQILDHTFHTHKKIIAEPEGAGERESERKEEIKKKRGKEQKKVRLFFIWIVLCRLQLLLLEVYYS